MNQLTSITVIIGIIAAVKAKFPQVNGWITVVLAAVLGGVAGFFGIDQLNIVSGVFSGLSAVGVHEVGKQIGGK